MSIKLQVRAFVLILRYLASIFWLMDWTGKMDVDKVKNLTADTNDWIIEAEAYARAVVE